MSELIDTTEMYLRTVYELEEEGITPLRARIAERLSQSGPTVSQTVARMERGGLLTVADDRTIILTPEGRTRATSVMRKHRLAEVLLTEVIGLPWSLVHDEACRWEHVISDAVAQRLTTILGDPAVSPYGNPIPGAAEATHAPLRSLRSVLVVPGPVEVIVDRIPEIVQADEELIGLLADAGVRPGTLIRVELREGALWITAPDGGTYTFEPELAQHLFVRVP